MPAGYQDLYLEQGTTFTTQITLDDNTGAALNLANFTVASQARKSYFSASPSITFDTSFPDAANGVILLSADAAATTNISPGQLVYDVVLTDTNSNNVTRVLEGKIYVSPSVTR